MSTSGAVPTPYIDPRHAVLLVIDRQEAFCRPDSQMEESRIGSSNQRAIIPDVLRLVEIARSLQLPVLWSEAGPFSEDTTRRRRAIPGHVDKQQWVPASAGPGRSTSCARSRRP